MVNARERLRKFQGGEGVSCVTVESNGNPEEATRKNRYPQHEGTSCFLEKPNIGL